MPKRLLLFAALVCLLSSSFGCARVSPPPTANFGSLALPADKGETQLSFGMAFGGEFLGGGGAGGQFRASHQVTDDWRVGAEFFDGDETSEPSDNSGFLGDGELRPGEGGHVRAGRLQLRHDLMRDDDEAFGVVFGFGAGHYSEGNLSYATVDVGLPMTVFSDVGALYFGPQIAISYPVEQDGLYLQEDDDVPYQYPATAYAALAGGAALNLGDYVRYVLEITPGVVSTLEQDGFGIVAAMSGGLVVQF